MYMVHAVTQFEDFSNPSIYDIELEHQGATLKILIDALNITPGSIEIIAADFGSNGRHHYPTSDNIFMKLGSIVTAAKNTPNNTMQE